MDKSYPSYSQRLTIVNSKNLFDLLQDDEEVEKKQTTKEAAPVAKKPVAPKTENKVDNRSPKLGGQSKPKRVNNGEQQVVGSEEHQSTKRDSKTHSKHQPRTDASGNIRNRQFDRKSGTGRPHNENKKGGAGQANWGKEGSVDAETNVATSNPTEGEKESTEVQTVAAPAVEDKTLTLGEYLKQQGSVSLEAPKLRVAGEGEAKNAQWDEFEPIQREVVKQRDIKSVKEEKKTKKNIIQVELKSAPSNQRPKGNAKKVVKEVDVEDVKSFPSLSKA
ncbi:hypothetical protein RB653_008398 [Dictyostelium firmibasis]|uniref:Hyaluronan/mRNA-binding protein domain-containing protein n=1 Tax=Dictyostelium firmibasis TaxID=79012 RepID=A0AAN7U094_9MYCE